MKQIRESLVLLALIVLFADSCTLVDARHRHLIKHKHHKLNQQQLLANTEEEEVHHIMQDDVWQPTIKRKL